MQQVGQDGELQHTREGIRRRYMIIPWRMRAPASHQQRNSTHCGYMIVCAEIAEALRAGVKDIDDEVKVARLRQAEAEKALRSLNKGMALCMHASCQAAA